MMFLYVIFCFNPGFVKLGKWKWIWVQMGQLNMMPSSLKRDTPLRSISLLQSYDRYHSLHTVGTCSRPRYCLPLAITLIQPWHRHTDTRTDYRSRQISQIVYSTKVHGANIGPTWVLSAPDGPHVGPMNLAIRVLSRVALCTVVSFYAFANCLRDELQHSAVQLVDKSFAANITQCVAVSEVCMALI